jgi:hypothetical protein
MKNQQAKKLWNSQPFLEKLIFLMNKFKISEDESTRLAKLEFDKLPLAYRSQICLFID